MNIFKTLYQRLLHKDVWARPKMEVTFRAEIMPGTTREERTYVVEQVLQNGRVILAEFPGQHRQTQFEPINYKRDVPNSTK